MHTAQFSTIISAPLDQVWDAWTKPELLKKFFFDTNMETTWEVGTPIFFRGAWDGKTYEDKGTVLSYNPTSEFSYSYWSSMSGQEDIPENYMTVTMMFEEAEGGTKISVEQSNAKTQDAADHSVESWKMLTGELEKFLGKQG